MDNFHASDDGDPDYACECSEMYQRDGVEWRSVNYQDKKIWRMILRPTFCKVGLSVLRVYQYNEDILDNIDQHGEQNRLYELI